MSKTKQTQFKNHEDFKIDGKWVQKFTKEKLVIWTTRSGVLWTNMTQRCKSGGSLQQRFPSYQRCENGFSDFQEFAEWCQHQVGYNSKDTGGRFWQLDKDILVKNNKVYSPDTCVFLPKDLNCVLESSKRSRGECPIGVYKAKNSYCASLLRGILGLPKIHKSFPNPYDAFIFYKTEKEKYLKQVADLYSGKVDPRVIKALYNYQVELED